MNRFDYDGDYGTVLNRFLVQAAVGHPLTVHGTGHQTRAFIHIRDSVRCIELAIENPPEAGQRVEIFNQATETHRLIDLANLVVELTGAKIRFYKNPRNEAAVNELTVTNDKFLALGLKPTTLQEGLLQEIIKIITPHADRVNTERIPATALWTKNNELDQTGSPELSFVSTPGEEISGEAISGGAIQGAFTPQYSFKTALSAVRFSFRSSWHLSKPRTLGIILLPLVQGILPAALALVVRGLINTIADAGAVTDDATQWIILSLVFSFLLATTVPVQRTLERINGEHLENDLVVRMLSHANTLDFAYFESARFRDHIAQATETPGYTTNDLIDKTSRSMSSFFTLVSLTIVLTAIEPRLLLWLPPVALPYLIHRWWISRIRYETHQTQWRSRRWAEYLTASLLDDRKLPEARLLNLSPLFSRRTESRLTNIFQQNRSLHRRELTGTILFNVLALVVIHFALWQVAKRAINGDVTVGDVAVFAGATGAIRNAVDGFVSSIGTLRFNVLNVRHLEHFLGLPPAFPGLTTPVAATAPQSMRLTERSPTSSTSTPALVLDSVGFRYPETTVDVLNDVSFEVAEGETVALVGANGSGKTTLVKLITGLYVPTAGEIRLADSPTTELDRLDFHRLVSVVFQQFDTYEASAAENIALGDWERLLDDRAAIEAIAEKTGTLPLINKLPERFDTELGRSFGSTALSGGQQQIFALARASARPVPIMILDEPTANLDAQSEYELFQNFKELAVGRATLLISHRFSTLALADRIVVLEHGQAAEQGHHDELIEADGLYAQMYRQFRNPAERSTRN